LIVKLVPAVLALIVGGAVAAVALHVTLKAVPRDASSCTRMVDVAVTAVVLTTTVVPDAATLTNPAGADAHTAGEAAEEQFVADVRLVNVAAPIFGVTKVGLVARTVWPVPVEFAAGVVPL
jgi:hypothetical protein